MSVLEVAKLRVDAARSTEFEAAFAEAIEFVRAAPGHEESRLMRSVETPGGYVFLVTWASVADHTDLFAQSEGFQSFVALVGSYFLDPPEVMHASSINEKESNQ